MNPEIRRFAELVVYVIVLAMLLGAALLSLMMGKSSDILLGGVMAGIIPTIQAIARIGQSESMNKMADALAQSQPIPSSPQQVEVMNSPGNAVPVEQQP